MAGWVVVSGDKEAKVAKAERGKAEVGKGQSSEIGIDARDMACASPSIPSVGRVSEVEMSAFSFFFSFLFFSFFLVFFLVLGS